MTTEENAERDTISNTVLVRAQIMSKKRKSQKFHPGDLQLQLQSGRICISPVREGAPIFCIAIHDKVGWHEWFVPVSEVLSFLSRCNLDQSWLGFLRDTVYGIRDYQHRHEAQLFLRLLKIAGCP